MKISHLTKRDIIDALAGTNWCGRLEEIEFLNRIFNLETLPSHDSRFGNAEADIWQHRVNNYDWEDDWVFDDERFSLRNGDDEVFLNFICETIHPEVRSDRAEVNRLRDLYNEHLKHDGFEIFEAAHISGRPVFAGRFVGLGDTPGVASARQAFSEADLTYVTQQITRMETAIPNDPELAIGTAKELVETCCKTILAERGVETPRSVEIAHLVKSTLKELQLTPADIPESAKAAENIKRLLSNLASVTQGLAELRNFYGTGHGKSARVKGLKARHAKLCVGVASTLSVFLMETHLERNTKP